MISFFRKFFQSKIGLPIFIGFLALVALAFAAADITGSTFGGVSGGARVAAVGDRTIAANELEATAQSAIQQVRRENPTITMPAFISEGGLDEVLSQLIDRYAIGEYARQNGLRAGDNLVNSEILQIPAFRGVSGEFDQDAYNAALRQQNLTDAILRRDLADGLLAQQLLLPALAAPQMPEKIAKQYASLLLEKRTGKVGLIPSLAFASDEKPKDEAIAEYYSQNRSQYVRPERRRLRYATFSAADINDDVSATEEEIAARFEANAEEYAASETRDITSFFVPTKEAAEALIAQIRQGKALETAAREAGFNATSVEGRTREEYSSSTSFAVAENVFETPEGQIAEPARSTFGWSVARVDDVTRIAARDLEDVREELAQEVRAQKQAAALADLSSRIEERVDSGTALTQIIEDFDLTLDKTPLLLSDGRVFDDPRSTANDALRPVLDTAFALDESQPQLDELVPGAQYIVYDVEEIQESAAPPLAEIREEIAADYKLATASKKAREAAKRVLERVRGGETLAKALDAEKTRLPPADTVSLERRELLQIRGRNPPPALVLLFSMAKGTTKMLEASGNQGWILVDLEEITSQPVEDKQLLAQTQQQLTGALASEYSQQLAGAIRSQVTVTTNEDAVEAVRRQLAGES